MAKQQLTLAKFLETVEKSSLLDPGRLSAYCQNHPEQVSARELAEHMVRDGMLTKFQADNLLKGRWGRYFIGPYKVLEKIGTGTNSQVYLCEHSKMKRRVAVKVLQADKAQDAEVLRRFEREAMAAAAVRHVNIVHAYDLGVEDRLHYLVMEYVDGVSLLKKLADGGRLSPRQAAAYMRQAAAGLQVAHDAGVVHRDIKPSNLMVNKDDRLKVLDLGLARYAGDDTALTRGDAVLGLAAYIAPEQASNSHAVDGRADLYGLGATFYLALTGKKPPVYGKFDPPPARTPSEEPDYQKMIGIIKKMMALRPEERYQSARELIVVLDEMGCEIITTPAPLMVSPTAEPLPGRSGTTGYQTRTEPEQVATTPAPVWTTPAPKPTAAPKSAPEVNDTRPTTLAETVTHLLETPGPSATAADLPLPKWGSSPGQTATPFGAAAAQKTHDPPLWMTLVKQNAPAAQPEATAKPAAPPLAPKPWGKWAFLAFAVIAFVAAIAYTFLG